MACHLALLGVASVADAQPQPPLSTCTAGETRATERYWFFGANGAIDFGVSGTTATALLGSQTTDEGSTVVTDTTGQLLFWSNGQTVFDRNNNPMPNGMGLLGNPSATQTVAAFPSLTQTGVYFVVATSGASEVGGTGELYYSVVDMSLDGGLGAVTATKNVQLGANGTASEGLTAVPNADGTGFWVLTFTADSPNILAYAFDGAGPVTGTAVVSPMSTNNGNRFGAFNFSADLTQLVQQTGSAGTGQVRLLTFDAASGAVTERFAWDLPTGAGTGSDGYAADFSPGGDFVYATKIFGGARLYRYRIAGAVTAAEVVATQQYLGEIGNGGQVRRAPDGRMYVANLSDVYLSVVNDPDNPTDPAFVASGFFLSGGASGRWGLPQAVTGCPVPLLDPLTDIVVAASVSKLATVPGDVVTAAISAQNLGPQDATGLVVTVTLPPGASIEGAAPAGYDLGTGQWTVGALANGSQVTLMLQLRLANAGALPVTATRTAIDQIDSNPDNDTATAALTAKHWSTFEADLVLTASTSPPFVEPGAVLTYALVGVNRGPTYVLDLFIEGTVPAGTTFEAVTPSSGGVCAAPAPGGTGAITCTWPGATLLDSGASRTAQLQVRVPADAAPGSSITGSFHVSSQAAEYYEPSNHALVITAVSDGTTADLALSGLMLSEGVAGTALPLPLGVATPLRFTVINQGPAATTAARYAVEVPETDMSGIQILNASVSQGAVALAGTAAADWHVGPLGPGEIATFDLTVAMHSMRATTLSMRRVESLPGDPNSANDTATLTLDGTGDPHGGERTTAIGNLDGAGLKEIVVGAGRLETPQVRIFTGDGQDTGLRFYAYSRDFVGGVRVAACDVDGDGSDEIITAPGIGPGPHVRVMRVTDQTIDEVVGFYAFDPAFAGGVSIACADVNDDGRAEVVAGMDAGGSEVRVFAVGPGSVVQTASFQAYEESFLGGVRVAALATNEPGGSQYQIVTVPGAGRPLELRGWAIAEGSATLVRALPLTGPEYQLGAFVDVADINNDGQLDALVATDHGMVSSVGALSIDSGQFIGIFQPFGSSFLGGARVTLGDIDANGQAELLISQGLGGRPVVDVYTLGNPAAFVFRITSVEIP